MSTALIVLGVGGVLIGASILGGKQRKLRRRQAARKTSSAVMQSYITKRQPIAPLEDVLFSKQVGGKKAILQSRTRGAFGSVKYSYYLPETGNIVQSYAPLDYHTAH